MIIIMLTIAAVVATLAAFVAGAFGWGYIEGRIQARRTRRNP